MKGVFLGVLLVVPLIASCSYEDTLNSILPKEESEFAKGYLENLRNKKFEDLKKPLSKELLTPDVESRMAQAASYFPEGKPLEIRAIGANVHTTPDKWLANLSYQYYFDNGWAVANILLEREKEGLVVKRVNVTRLPKPLEEIYAFDFKGKKAVHYVFLVLAIAIPLFILYSLILCIRTPINKKKWLWVVFILVGVVAFRLDWTTGQFAVQLVNINLLGAGTAKASPYAPLILTISIPLGAIIFLAKRRSMIKES